MRQSRIGEAFRRLMCVAIAVGLVVPAGAEVVYDGTAGPEGSASGEMEIPDWMGTQIGANLFHSFAIFNILTGESATFTSRFNGVTDNVIARVTGQQASILDGLLATTIPGAALWLVNPNGIVFGENARLDVQGSFHASTADYLLLADGGRFGADLSLSGNTVLTMANPSAFGFVGSRPAPIVATGADLAVGQGAALSLVGGAVELRDTALTATGGRIDITAVGSPGEIAVGPSGHDIGNVGALGAVTFEDSTIEVTDGGDGGIYIRGGEFFLIDSTIGVTATNDTDAGDLEIHATGDAILSGDSSVTSRSRGAGAGGDVTIRAANLTIEDGANVRSTAEGAGRGGNITIDVDGELVVRTVPIADDDDTDGDDNGDDDNGDDETFTGLFASTTGSGRAGDVSVAASFVNVVGEGEILSDTLGDGRGGNVTIDAGSVTLDDDAEIASDVDEGAAGAGGNVTISADTIVIGGNSEISSDTGGSGQGGSISLSATGSILIKGLAGVFADAEAAGNAGNIALAAPIVTIDGGTVGANAVSSAGGNIAILASDTLHLLGGIVNTSAGGVSPGDDGGNVTIGRPTFLVMNDGTIRANANAGNGGNIDLAADNVLRSDDSVIDASSRAGLDGRIVVETPDGVTLKPPVLEVPVFDFSDLLDDQCAAGSLRSRSSLTLDDAGAVPPGPRDYRSVPDGEPGATPGDGS